MDCMHCMTEHREGRNKEESMGLDQIDRTNMETLSSQKLKENIKLDIFKMFRIV